MATYLLLCGIIQSNIQSTSVILLFFGFYISFFYLFAFAVSPLVAGALSPNSARIFLLLFSVVMSGIGVAQAVTKNLFAFGYYITSSVDSINATTSGKVRASAFFNHSDDLGVFLCIPLAIAVTSFFRAHSRGRKLIFLSCILIIVAGCAATLTRIVYLSAAITLFLTIWGELRQRDSRIFAQGHIFPMWLPLLLMVIGLSLFFVRYLVEAVLMNVSFLHDYRYLVSSKSLDERLYGIYYYLKHIDSFGMTGWIFGLGWIFRSNMKALVPIDNGFVGVLLNVGVLGAVIWAWLSFRCWQILNKMAARSNNELALPFTAFYALWLLLQVFGAYLQPFMVAVLCVATLTPEWIRRFGIESSRG